MKLKLVYKLFIMSLYGLAGIVLQCFALTVLLASPTEAQKKTMDEITVSVHASNAELREVFNKIQDQTSFEFAYDHAFLNDKEKISLSSRNESLADVLRYIAHKKKLQFKRVNETIYIQKHRFKGKVTELIDENIRQTLVKGSVTADDGEVLPGVSILIKGTSTGTTTDFNGNYSLNVNEGATLVFSYIGFVDQEVEVGSQSVINVQLEADLETLEEVVVVGYGTQEKKDVTGAIGTVSTEDFEAQPVTRVDQVLQGRSPGVVVTNSSGAPGGTVSIRIRGANSINGNNDPLYVIDGFVGADFRDVNPTDIETIQILKDASATAVYGSRGSNGVVLITTKSGVKGKPKLSFTARFSTSKLINEWDLMDAGTFAETVNLRAAALGTNPKFTDEEIAGYKQNGGTDWQNELFRTGTGQEYQLDYSGGTEAVSYFISGNYLSQEGIAINSNYKRYALRSNINANLSEKLTANIKMNFNRRETNNVGGGGNTSSALAGPLTWAPTTPARDANGNLTVTDPISAIFGNPIENAQNDHIDEINSFITNGSLKYEFIDGLSLDIGFGLNYSNQQYKLFEKNSLSNNPRAQRQSTERIFLQNTNNLTYSKRFASIHKVTATAVLEHQLRQMDQFGTVASGLFYPALKYDNITLANSSTSSAYREKQTIRSYIGRVNYELMDKYLVTASIRSDGSSKFRGSNQYSTFPSIALGWRLSEEAFLSGGFFDDLKLRGSWGETGSQAIGVFGTVTTYNTNATDAAASFNNGTELAGVVIGNPGNADLKWETTAQWNIGLDMQVFDGRLGITLDYFDKSTTDLLLSNPLPKYAGGGNILKNIGEIKNTGFELGITSTVIDNDNFRWYTTFNASFLKNEIVDIGDQEAIFFSSDVGAGLTNVPENVLKPGYPLSSYWGLNYLGTWKTGEETEASRYGNVPGDSRYEDLNDDGTIGGDDYKIIGTGTPETILGWNNTFEYKNFSLNLFFMGMGGYDKWNFGYATGVMPNADAREAVHSDVLNRWVAGTNEGSDIPHFSSTTVDEIQSTRFVEKGDFIRLKNISLTYSLPKDVIKGVGAQFLISGTNVWTITDYKGLDPEAYSNNGLGDSSGGDAGSYPNSKSWTFGVNFIF
ncbi:TonB-dependent receptor [Flexithrix dorotheae]|uniref:TonB-dependent receptor n=1 Tax=Flexithrix dorotheae TaxID=70993 RepID=UPI0003A46C30|nr:TonB-dependent receptor [Flexithrix dorotheae]